MCGLNGMGIGRIGGLWREGNYESARGFHWYYFPKTDPLSPPHHPPTSYIINTYTHVPIPVYVEARGDPPSCTIHMTIAAVGVLMYLFPNTRLTTAFLCYLRSAHKGTSINLCTPKLLFVLGAYVCVCHTPPQAIHH